MATVTEIGKAVRAELRSHFLTYAGADVGRSTFLAQANALIQADDDEAEDLVAGNVSFSPIYASLVHLPGESRIDVGIGWTLTENAPEAGFGGFAAIRNFRLGVSVIVRGTLGDPYADLPTAYAVLLLASEFLLHLGGKTGGIGVGGNEVDILSLDDAGENAQVLDDNGDYYVAREFILAISTS